MGECHCSNIAIMQLFHELKQQFPALPDHVVSQCIAQNSHDRETCARSLRATQESRPSPGAFPPPAPDAQLPQQQPKKRQSTIIPQRCSMIDSHHRVGNHTRAHRPASLDIGLARRSLTGCLPRAFAQAITVPLTDDEITTPASAPAICTTRGFFDDGVQLPIVCNINNLNNTTNEIVASKETVAPQSGFEVNVNVACSPAGNHDFRTAPSVTNSGCKRSTLRIEPRPHYAIESQSSNHTRGYTSVSLTLRPPSSDPQPPIEICSQGSSLTYSTSSLDPRGFQSHLQISIGSGSVASARIKPPMAPSRPTSLLSLNLSPQKPPGLPAGPPSQLPRPTTTTTMSAPTTPSVPLATSIVPCTSLPTTPLGHKTISPLSSPTEEKCREQQQAITTPLNQVAEHQKKLLEEQLARKERLARELRAEKGRLEAMKKELQSLTRPSDSSVSPQDLKRKLRSEIYQLQVECDRLADEVDQRSDPRVPLGETNEEFYQGIYTGQPFLPRPSNNTLGQAQPPPLPSQPPAWQSFARPEVDREERDGPSWVCRMCTFDNHPLMNKCEQCDMPRLLDHGSTGTTRRVKSNDPIPSTSTAQPYGSHPSSSFTIQK